MQLFLEAVPIILRLFSKAYIYIRAPITLKYYSWTNLTEPSEVPPGYHN